MAATPDGLPEPGAELAHKYRIQRVIGEGGMGIVYEALHLRLHQRVAIKMLLPKMRSMPDQLARFAREAHAAGQLKSRHAARVLDVDTSPSGLPYLVMEFLEGHDLGVELDRCGSLAPEVAVDYVLQACVALHEAHGVGIVHRDLKPPNLFLANEDDVQVVKLLDFGISKLAQEAGKITEADSMIGTALYMSPEQVRAADKVDRRSDIWSLGVILFELLSGKTPWVGTTTQVAAAIVTEEPPPLPAGLALPSGLERVVRIALSRDLDERFQSVGELADALLPYAEPGAIGALGARAVLAGPSSAPRSGPRLSASQLAVARREVATVSIRTKSRDRTPEPEILAREPHRQARSSWRAPALVVAAVIAVAVGLGLAALRRDDPVPAPKAETVVEPPGVPAARPLPSTVQADPAAAATSTVGSSPRAAKTGARPASAAPTPPPSVSAPMPPETNEPAVSPAPPASNPLHL